jgi:hypothetical protein
MNSWRKEAGGLRRRSWSPYAVGAGIGILSWFAFASVKFAGAFFGGAVMMFGARVAQGCTSGHCVEGAA